MTGHIWDNTMTVHLTGWEAWVFILLVIVAPVWYVTFVLSRLAVDTLVERRLRHLKSNPPNPESETDASSER